MELPPAELSPPKGGSIVYHDPGKAPPPPAMSTCGSNSCVQGHTAPVICGYSRAVPHQSQPLLCVDPTQSSETGKVQGLHWHNLPRERKGHRVVRGRWAAPPME